MVNSTESSLDIEEVSDTSFDPFNRDPPAEQLQTRRLARKAFFVTTIFHYYNHDDLLWNALRPPFSSLLMSPR